MSLNKEIDIIFNLGQSSYAIGRKRHNVVIIGQSNR